MNHQSWTVNGKVAIVTGATSGLGKISALKLAELGARLYLICRNRDKAETVCREIRQSTGNQNINVLIADLSSQASVRNVANEFLSNEDRLDILLNNAGAIFSKERKESEDGIEMTFALNHLSYFSLTLLLLDALFASAPSRIVNVASDGYSMGGDQFRFDDFNAEKDYSLVRQYGQSKLANILFTRELAQRLTGTGVTVNSASPPGLTATGFGQGVHPLMKFALYFLRPFVNSTKSGAESQLMLCTSPELSTVSGKHFTGLKEAELLPEACNDPDAAALWQLSEKLTGIRWTDVSNSDGSGSSLSLSGQSDEP